MLQKELEKARRSISILEVDLRIAKGEVQMDYNPDLLPDGNAKYFL